MEANKLVVTVNCKKDLLITAKWSRIYAIISIFSVAILLVVGIVLLVSSFFIDNQQFLPCICYSLGKTQKKQWLKII